VTLNNLQTRRAGLSASAELVVGLLVAVSCYRAIRPCTVFDTSTLSGELVDSWVTGPPGVGVPPHYYRRGPYSIVLTLFPYPRSPTSLPVRTARSLQ